MTEGERVESEFEDPRRALARHGLSPKRSFSQNFLVARSVVEAIAEAAAPTPGMRVVELGPGLGTLTAALLRRGARVIAVERDRDMIAVLRADLAGRDLTIVEGDAASVDFGELAGDTPIAVVGNLPYAITGAILRNLIAHRARISRAVVMVQKEVRDRLLEQPGSKTYGILSVFVQAAFEVRPLLRVPAGCFHPPPKIESAVALLLPREVPRAEETPSFVRIVHAGFGTRRKTLRNALSRELGREVTATLLERTGIDGDRRAETLSIEELAALASALDAIG